MYAANPVRRRSVVLSLIVVVASLALALGSFLARRVRRRHALERLHEKVQFGQDLVCYVQRRQCSEEVAYQLIADFVKMHVLPNERTSIDNLVAQSRESLLLYFPEELDEI
jgi:hypothetical protein